MTRFAVLFVVWIGLWGELSVANVLSGIVVIGLMLRLLPPDRQMRHRIHPIALASFAVRLLWALIVSAARVSVAVVLPTPARTRTEIVEVRLSTDSELVAAVMANAITLVPGTMTVDVRPAPMRLDVHVFGFDDRLSFLAEMAELERQVLAAFEPLPARVSEERS